MRMAYDADGAIRVLRDGLKPDRPHTFVQADMLVRPVLIHPPVTSSSIHRRNLAIVDVRISMDSLEPGSVPGGSWSLYEDHRNEFLVRIFYFEP